MDYAACYGRLMQRASRRHLSGYIERHHIVPRCMGGDNSTSNIAKLTPDEHYVAHQLLVKMYPGNSKLVWAALWMTGASRNTQRNNKIYGWLKRRLSAARTAAQLGKPRGPFSDEHRARLSAAAKGKPKSAAHAAASAKARLGIKPKRSEAWRMNHAAAMRRVAKTIDKSFTQNPEYKARQSERMKQIWAERKARAGG